MRHVHWYLQLAFLVLATGSAQSEPASWAVQTVAVRDLHQAQEVRGSLERFGFDAYTEFAMYQGRQYVRVRIGCFMEREMAELIAAALAGRITAEAAVVPFTPGAPVLGCVRRDLGFLKPRSWETVHSGESGIGFRVRVAGQEAFLLHNGTAWRVLQSWTPQEDLDEPGGPFRQIELAGSRFVGLRLGDRELILCAGTLLWQDADTAIVDYGEGIAACELLAGAALLPGTP